MWGALLGGFSLILVVAISVALYLKHETVKSDLKNRINSVVNQINDSQTYEYNFDKLQEENIKSVDQNVSSLYDAVIDVQKNVKHLDATTLKKDSLLGDIRPSSVSTKKLTLGDRYSLIPGASPDDWVKLSNRNGTAFDGGFAASKIWAVDSATVGGAANIDGPLTVSGAANFKGGVSEKNPNSLPSQFPNPDGKNYVRGNTEIWGHVNNLGSMRTDRLKAGHSQTGGWIDAAPLSARSGAGVPGASFGRDLWSHFPWSDGNTYVRAGSTGKRVMIGDNNSGPVGIGNSWLPNENGQSYIRSGGPGKNVNIADVYSPVVNIGKGDTVVNARGNLNVTGRLCVGSTCISASDLQKLKTL